MRIEEFQKKYGRLPTETDPDYLREIERRKIVSRFQVLNYPMMMPGKCTVNGCTGLDRKYVDFGLSLDYYGVVYICTVCIKELVIIVKDEIDLGKMLEELVPVPEVTSPTSDTIAQDIKKIQEVASDVARRIEGVLESHGVKPPTDPNVSDNISTPDDSTPVDIPPSEPVNEEKPNSPIPNRTKPRAAKSTSSSRRQNVPSFTGFGQNKK